MKNCLIRIKFECAYVYHLSFWDVNESEKEAKMPSYTRTLAIYYMKLYYGGGMF